LAEHRGLVAAGVGYGLVLVLLLGGAIDRFARGAGSFVLGQFLGACGRYFVRLLKLTVLSTLLYWGLFLLAKRAYGALGESLKDVTVESTILTYYLIAAVPLLVLVGVVMMVFDYARVAAILEEEGSTVRSLRRGLRFVTRRPLTVMGLSGLVAICVCALVALRTVVTPPVAEATVPGIVLVFLLGQLFVATRLVLRLTLVASEVALFQESR